MVLIEILLPLRHNENGRSFKRELEIVRKEMTSSFGGVTAFSRAPALGETKAKRTIVRDDIIVFEVMVGRLNKVWWRKYRSTLERRFDQDEVIVRALRLEKL